MSSLSNAISSTALKPNAGTSITLMIDNVIKKHDKVLFDQLISQLHDLANRKAFSDNLSRSLSKRIILWLNEDNSLFALTTALKICKALNSLSKNSDRIIALIHKVYLYKFSPILTQIENEELDQIGIASAFLANEDYDPLHFFNELNHFHSDLDKIFGIDPNHQDGETILAIIELFKSVKEGFELLSEQQ